MFENSSISSFEAQNSKKEKIKIKLNGSFLSLELEEK